MTFPKPPYTLDQILLLGDPRLYERAAPVAPEELPALEPVAAGMADLVVQFRRRHGKGRAIAAPQIGIAKQLVVLHIDRPIAIYNPSLQPLGEEKMVLWDDCMSFPQLLVRVERHARVALTFRDQAWRSQTWTLEDDMAELLQHECDHLDGTLATMRALDARSFRWLQPPASTAGKPG